MGDYKEDQRKCTLPCAAHLVQQGQCSCYSKNHIAMPSFTSHDTTGNMCKPQPVQLDCRNDNCIHNTGAGYCMNDKPAITLNADKSFVCWSKKIKP